VDLSVLKNIYSIYKFSVRTELPGWIYDSDLFSITGTPDELSVVAKQSDNIPGYIVCNRNWRILKIEGPLDLSVTGIIAELSSILNEKKIPIFVVSTYDTDYLMVKQDNLDKAIEALIEKNHNILTL
jgi:hypothetical protein